MSNNNENKALAPFSCQFSPQVPELLLKLNCTIAISTYQAGKIVLSLQKMMIHFLNCQETSIKQWVLQKILKIKN